MEFNPYNDYDNSSDNGGTPQLAGIVAGISKTRVLLSLSDNQNSASLPKSLNSLKM